METSRFKNGGYDSPSWAYEQADLNGAIREVDNLLNLLSFIKGPK